MRKVKVGAIQPQYIGIPSEYSFCSGNYRNVPEEIVNNYVTKQLDVTFNLLEQAGRNGCDIVTTCEDIAGIGDFIMDIAETNIFPELLELTQPLIEKRLESISRKFSMYVIGCYYKRIGDRVYNVASIFNRKGKNTGEYRKTHLPSNEKWQCAEGENLDVFELDFGKVGVCICYDMMFPETIGTLALKGAEIIFHPTMGYGWYDSIGEATLRTRANDHSVYLVTAKNYVFNAAGKSSIIDFWGQVLADAGFYENTAVSREIDLGFKKTQPDWYYPVQTSGIKEVDARKLMERRPELYTPITVHNHKKLRQTDRGKQLEVLQKIKSGQCRW